MDANEEKILSTLETGQRLVDSGNLYSERVKDKMGSIEDRSVFYIISAILHPRSDIQHNLHITVFFDLAYEPSTK